MHRMIYEGFDRVKADDGLKRKTLAFLRQKRKGFAPEKTKRRRSALCALATFAILTLGMGYRLNFMPVAYVDVDVNPSIELAVNGLGRVLAATPYNLDGEKVLEEANVRQKPYGDGLSLLLDAMISQGYLQQDGLVSVTIQAGSAEERMLNGITAAVDTAIQAHNLSAEKNIFPVTEKIKCDAKENRLTPAKYLAIEALCQVDPTTTFQSCCDHSISEICQWTLNPDQGGHAAAHHPVGCTCQSHQAPAGPDAAPEILPQALPAETR